MILKYRQEDNIPVDIILSDGSKHPYPGKVDFIDNTADPKANTINMRAVISNPDKTLLPGVYVQADLFLCDVPDTPLVSEKAIGEDQTGSYVFVVGKGNKVEKRSVKVGFVYKNKKIIWKGLKAGEKVIVGGLQMIRPGMEVNPQPAGAKDSEGPEKSGSTASSKKETDKKTSDKSDQKPHGKKDKGGQDQPPSKR